MTRKMKMRRYWHRAGQPWRVVRLCWQDAWSEDAWHSQKTPGQRADCTTIGFLVEIDAEYVRVAGTIDAADMCCVMAVPRKMVLELEEVLLK